MFVSDPNASPIQHNPDPTFGAPRNPKYTALTFPPAPDALNQVKKGFKRFFSLRKKAAKKTAEQKTEPAPAATTATAAPVAAAATSETPAEKPTAPAATPDSAPGMTLSYQIDINSVALLSPN